MLMKLAQQNRILGDASHKFKFAAHLRASIRLAHGQRPTEKCTPQLTPTNTVHDNILASILLLYFHLIAFIITELHKNGPEIDIQETSLLQHQVQQASNVSIEEYPNILFSTVSLI